MNALAPLVRSVPVVLALILLSWVLTGCRPPYESRYDAVPGPVGTADIVAASLDEPTPLTPDEWQAADAAVDSYLRAYDELHVGTIAPFVRDMRQDRSNRWLNDDAELLRMGKRAQSVLGRIRSQDEALFSELVSALPNRTALVERVRSRRAIDRALRVTAGRDERGAGEGFMDLDLEVGAILARPVLADRAAALRTTLEPLRAAYRQELGSAAGTLADALVEFPADRLKVLRESGISDASIDTYVRGAGQPGTTEEREAIHGAVRRSQARMTRALIAIDDLNTRTVEAWSALLPPDAAELLRSEATFRRTHAEGLQPVLRWYVEVLEVLPELREGRAPKTAAAVRAMRAATDDYGVAAARLWRSQANQSGADASPSLKDLGDRVQRANEAVRIALQEATKMGDEELPPDTLAKLQALMRASQSEARNTLEQLVGRTNTTRLLARAPHSMFNPEPQQDEMDGNRSLALQVLLGPMAGRPEFERLAQAFGAKLGDPVMDELWQRYHDRAEALTLEQDEALRAQEKAAQQRGEESSEDPAAFEREMASYLRMILASDEARGQLMNDTLMDMAAARGISSDDARVKVARAQLAVARSAVPWRRFQLPWLVGPLWLAQADTLALIAAVTPDDPASQAAALAVTAGHAAAIEQAALSSRMAGFEALRDFVTLVLKLQRDGAGSSMAPDEIPTLPAAQTLVKRVREAATLRAEAQLELIDAMEPALGPARHARLRAAYAAETFPEFFAERPWYADARSMADGAADNRAPLGTPAARIATAAAHWREVDGEMMARLLLWQRSPASVAPPLRTPDLASISLEDGELASLRMLRDENAQRFLRDAAVAAGQAPNARMPGVLRSVSRPTLRIAD